MQAIGCRDIEAASRLRFRNRGYAGNFLFCLSPVGDEYVKSIQTELRATIDTGSDPIKAKIAKAEHMKVHTMLVIGQRDLEANHVSVRIHGKEKVGSKPRADFILDILAAIQERCA